MNNNPWLNIPLSDYENHMSSPKVGQLQMLDKIFKNLYGKYKPANILIAGCTSGNGFEHIDFSVTKKLVGIDINQSYLEIAKSKFGNKNGQIEYRRCDICECKLEKNFFDLIHCALIFEYVKPEECLGNLIAGLKKGGILSVVLQLPGKKQNKVSETEYKSLKILEPVINLIEPGNFNQIIKRFGVSSLSEESIGLESGKEFYLGVFERK